LPNYKVFLQKNKNVQNLSNMVNFWNKLNKNFSVLAPMEDVTDTVFRQVIIHAGRPDVMFTEFTNCDGMCSLGQAQLIHRLKYSVQEKPIVAQIWGANPTNYEETARLCTSLGFDGIDINMGCPEKNVVKIGACAALIDNEELATKIIEATIRGCDGKIPVSIKTRIGYSKIDTIRWITFLLSHDIQALTIHGRTAKEMSLVDNHWEEILKACKLKQSLKPDIKIIINGDIIDSEHGIKLCEDNQADGYMIGRGVFKNPWCFNSIIDINKVTKKQRLELMQFHLNLWIQTWKDTKHYPKLKKYFKIYCQSFSEAAELRNRLMETNNIQEAIIILQNEIDIDQ
jgi:tRNA-dihydrouridine synthase